MSKRPLSFAEINLLAPDLIELIVDQGVEIMPAHLRELHAYFSSLAGSPARLLVNKANPYSFSFEAIRLIGASNTIAALAVVNYISGSLAVANYVKSMLPASMPWEMKNFTDREHAMAWLLGSSRAREPEA